MNVLIAGSERENQIWAAKLAHSSSIRRVTCWSPAQGDDLAGRQTQRSGDRSSVAQLARYASQTGVDMVIATSAVLLKRGLANALQVFRIECFGPTKAGLVLEEDRRFTQSLLARHAVPFVASTNCRSRSEAERAVKKLLTAGRVVRIVSASGGEMAPAICHSWNEVQVALGRFAEAYPGPALHTSVSEHVEGFSFSFAVFIGLGGVAEIGAVAVGPQSQGVITEVPVLLREKAAMIVNRQIVPALHSEGLRYTGCLNITFVGGGDELRVLDTRCRMTGDEISVLIDQGRCDWMEMISQSLPSVRGPRHRIQFASAK